MLHDRELIHEYYMTRAADVDVIISMIGGLEDVSKMSFKLLRWAYCNFEGTIWYMIDIIYKIKVNTSTVMTSKHGV